MNSVVTAAEPLYDTRQLLLLLSGFYALERSRGVHAVGLILLELIHCRLAFDELFVALQCIENVLEPSFEIFPS